MDFRSDQDMDKLGFGVLARQRPWLSLWESCQPNRLTERVLRWMVGQRLLERGTLSDCPMRGSQLSQRESQGRFAPYHVQQNTIHRNTQSTNVAGG